jgi:hypothetical protein
MGSLKTPWLWNLVNGLAPTPHLRLRAPVPALLTTSGMIQKWPCGKVLSRPIHAIPKEVKGVSYNGKL